MDDKLKIFWNLEVLVKMSRSKNDGPSLRIEELEIENKIKTYRQEIEEIESISDEENYDTSAEMADRNIEIITKKQIQVLRSELKEKNKELNEQKTEEGVLYEKTNLLRQNINSQEKYIESMQERVSELVEIEILDRYNGLIAETTEKVNTLKDELEEESRSYNEVQENIVKLTEQISEIEEKIAKKKVLLSETQAHLENKDNYIDHTKTEKNTKRVKDLESKIEKLTSRIDVLRQDPQYLETKIKDVINNKYSNKKAKQYLIDLINQVIRVPYINVPTDNLLEEELLRATQARDSFANDIDQKTYNILEADTPEKLRIEFLTERISKWKEQLEVYNKKIAEIDNDEQYNYERKERILSVMINSMKNDVVEFERAYEDVPETNIGAKSSIKAALEEKKEDLIEAEKIATLFRKDEAEDIAHATRIIKYECDQINKNIIQANDEIQKITNRLTSKKSGLIDISTRNKDKDILKELAQIVIDIKHRRQFPETPIEIIERLEEDLNLNLRDCIDMDVIEETSELIPKNYEEYYTKNSYNIDEIDNNINQGINEEYYSNEEYNNASINNFEETYNRLIRGEEAAENSDISYEYPSSDGTENYENYDEYQNYDNYEDGEGTTYVYEGDYANGGYVDEYGNEYTTEYTDEYPDEYTDEYQYQDDYQEEQDYQDTTEYDNSELETVTDESTEEIENNISEESDETNTETPTEETPDYQEPISEEEQIEQNINEFYSVNNIITDHSSVNEYPEETSQDLNDIIDKNETMVSEETPNEEVIEENVINTETPIIDGEVAEPILENNNVLDNPLEEPNEQLEMESLTESSSEFQPYNEELSFDTIDNNLDSMTTDVLFAKPPSELTPTEPTDLIVTEEEQYLAPEDAIDANINEFNADAVIDSLMEETNAETPENIEQITMDNPEAIVNNEEVITDLPYQDIISTNDGMTAENFIQPEQQLESPPVEQPANEYIELSSEPQQQNQESQYQEQVISQEPILNTIEPTPEVDNIGQVENINTEGQNSDNIYSNEQLESELDNYISSLENENS